MPAGLENDGKNVCFMNALLQCLASFPVLFSTEIGPTLRALAYAEGTVLDVNMQFHEVFCQKLGSSSDATLKKKKFCEFKMADSTEFFDTLVLLYPQLGSYFKLEGRTIVGVTDILYAAIDQHNLSLPSGGRFLDALFNTYNGVIFDQWPALLAVQINYAGHTPTTVLENNVHIDENVYRLRAIALHLGAHYVAFAIRKDQWYEFDDSSVSKIEFSSLLPRLSSRSFCLFYEHFVLAEFLLSGGDLTKLLK